MLLFETAKSYTYNLTGLPPYRFLAPVSRESVFVIRYVCIAVNQGKQLLFYLVIRIHGIAEIKHSGNYTIRFLLLIVRQWILQPLVTMSFGISYLFGKASVPKS